MLNETDKIAELLVALEMPVKYFILFLVFIYVVWFWKVGPYDGFMTTLQTIKMVVEKAALIAYAAVVWVFVSFGRVFRVVFATVRDFFMSRI